jgi:hypothetical protein
MSPVKAEATVDRRGIGSDAVIGLPFMGCTGSGTELETTVDQALIRGLGTAIRVFVSGLSSV